MRLFLDTVIALMLVALMAGVVWHTRSSETLSKDRQVAKDEVRRFQQQIALQSALAKVQRNERGYPEAVDPGWFQGSMPVNPLITGGHPWLEVAAPDQKELTHPPDRTAANKSVAKFWYNPHTGMVRARVPAELSDADAVELYNFVNGCNLPDLFSDGTK